MPRKEHLRRCLRLDILLDELLKQRISYHMILVIVIQLTLLQIITVLTPQVTKRIGRFQHNIHRMTKGNNGIHKCFVSADKGSQLFNNGKTFQMTY